MQIYEFISPISVNLGFLMQNFKFYKLSSTLIHICLYFSCYYYSDVYNVKKVTLTNTLIERLQIY